ncbi:MAG: Spy/CpxP family protein refolding chaperone [Bacteroidota bacterium]
MRKERLLWILIMILIAVNAATLFFIVTGPPAEGGKKFDRTIIRELSLTEEQVAQFEIMKRAHHQEITQLDGEMRSTYEKYFYLLAEPTDSLAKDSLENILSTKQKEKIQITYQHFNDLRKICTPEQREKFKDLVPILMHVITPQKNPRPPRRN